MTIAVCAKNAEKTIGECIKSIIDQKYPSKMIRVIIVVGRSNDKTTTIAANVASKTDLGVDIFSDEGKGLGAARQIAVDHANEKYLIFVDSDVRIFDDFVQKHVSFMEKNPNVGIAFGRPMYQEGPLISTLRNLHHYVEGGLVGNDATIYRFEALKLVGGFDVNIKGASEDRDLITRIRRKGWQISNNEKARFFHDSRENIRDFLNERVWFGYGDHYFNHKHRNVQSVWRMLWIGQFAYFLRSSFKAYRLTRRKISFLIPLLMALGNIAWWVGFFKGHMNGYGHKVTE